MVVLMFRQPLGVWVGLSVAALLVPCAEESARRVLQAMHAVGSGESGRGGGLTVGCSSAFDIHLKEFGPPPPGDSSDYQMSLMGKGGWVCHSRWTWLIHRESGPYVLLKQQGYHLQLRGAAGEEVPLVVALKLLLSCLLARLCTPCRACAIVMLL